MATKIYNMTPLMRAAAIGHESRVKELVEEEGVNVNEKGPRESTALMFAAGSGHLEIVKFLVESGASVNDAEGGGWTAKQLAEDTGVEDVVVYLDEKEKELFAC